MFSCERRRWGAGRAEEGEGTQSDGSGDRDLVGRSLVRIAGWFPGKERFTHAWRLEEMDHALVASNTMRSNFTRKRAVGTLVAKLER